MTSPVDPVKQNVDEVANKPSNFKFLPGSLPSAVPQSNVIVQSSTTTPAGGGVVSGGGGGGGGTVNPPSNPPVNPGTWTLPAGFAVTFSPEDATQPGQFGTVITDATGNQTISVDIICPAVTQAVSFEVKYA
jgi:hypothetical protein